ncbi:MAG: hypothetical protein U1E70_04490 [Acetobacteraceae bacterium]|nr:hypothetical protein [Pseudomonadota bacterium]
MLPDEPDEDAANLDDDALLDAYLNPSPAEADQRDATRLPDWPKLTVREVGLSLDTATLDWFRAHHADWRREIGFVLKAWVAAQTAANRAPSGDLHAPDPSARD